ncbi:metallophosphoesterase, partial [Patescibacteria group bacterium]
MAAPLTEFRTCRKQDDHLTIAHISDLHFHSGNTPAGDHFVSLQTEIAKSKVDTIIVTGDVVDNPLKEIFDGLWDEKYTVKDLKKLLRPHRSLVRNWVENLTGTLEEARSFLKQLCEAADVKYPELLCTIPGNHDLRIQGVTELRFFGTVNLAVDNIEDQPFTKIFGMTSQDRLVSFSKGTTDSIISVAIVHFNSNGVDPVLNFATGKVGEDDLNRIRQLESDASFQKAHKIVLMHHHPMPIPESEGTPGVKGVFGGDQFLLLKNAGVVMRELVRSKIDLVLHGHKHYSGFSHVNFNFPLLYSAGHEAAVARHQVSVVGAGSAGIYSEGYTFNIVKLYDDGRIYVEEKRRDRSGGYFPKRQFWLVSYEQKRIQRYDHCAESLQTELRARAKKLVYSVNIEEDGDAIERRDFTGLQALDQERDDIPHILRSLTGYLGSDEKPNIEFQS